MPHDVQPLIDQPRLPPHLQLPWDTFWMLQADRQTGFSIGAIPTSAIIGYLRNHLGMHNFAHRDWLLHCVRGLDIEFVSLVHKRQDEEKELKEQPSELAKPEPRGVIS